MSELLKLALMYKYTKSISSRREKLAEKHQNKLNELERTKSNLSFRKNRTFISNTIHNLSSYELTTDEKLALSNGLEQHIPSQLNKNDIQTEFECFYQDILKNVPSLTEDEKSTLKTKLRNTCEQSSK